MAYTIGDLEPTFPPRNSSLPHLCSWLVGQRKQQLEIHFKDPLPLDVPATVPSPTPWGNPGSENPEASRGCTYFTLANPSSGAAGPAGGDRRLCSTTATRDWRLPWFGAQAWRVEQFATLKAELCCALAREEVTSH